MKHKKIILAYHHFTTTEVENRSKLYIDKIKFLEHLHAIKKMNLKISKNINELMNAERDAVHITVDDGYLNFYEHAFPILKKYKISATLFISTLKIGRTCFESDYGKKLSYCNKEQLMEMLNSGLVNIEAHGHSHNRLGDMTKEFQEREIETCLEIFKKINIKISHFCYPYGSYNHDTLEILRRKGIVSGCTTKSGVNLNIKKYELARIAPHSRIRGDSLAKYIKKH